MMRMCRSTRLGVAMMAVLAGVTPGSAATFSSSSTGSLGAFAPSSNTTVVLPADGILNYTTVAIPAGVTVTFQRNSTNTPVTMLATGDISIAGTIDVSGQNAVLSVGSTPAPGGLGGPGGFSGGMSGSWSNSNFNGTAGQGPGGGRASIRDPFFTTSDSGTYGGPSGFVRLLPLFGGSGGGGAAQPV